jgi:hypothetical protein
MNLHRNSAVLAGYAVAAGLAMAVVSLATPQAAPAKAPSIEGVWKITDVTATGANPMANPTPQAGFYFFSHGHYSVVADNGRAPRTAAPVKDPANPTDAEKVAKYQEWAPVVAQVGTYELKGATLIRLPTVAKNVSAIGPAGQAEAEIKLTGDTLVIISKAPAGQPARELRLTMTRVP